ncbi:MAG TPA: glycoside hydrolase domain-containing protein [Thermoleophilaceae bacterium]|nr:glycoside hydrolase domain-containing protein [Thermoleophilaceae bacterium]
MTLQGLDRQVAPAADLAKRMLDQIGGGWWNVYIGGPESGPGWSPEVVREYARHGIDHFMLTYVGRQKHGPLTAAQGKADAIEALKIAESYGYSGSFPLCLDVEISTYESARTKTIAYAKAWCSTVRSAGARPGIYANPAPLKGMSDAKVPAEFVWVASWQSHEPAPHDPHAIPQLPHELWSKPGERAWQYAAEFGNRKCQILGLDVDINVADVGCLATAPGAQHGHQQHRVATGARLVRRGSRGKAVQQLTRRLSFVPSKKTGHPYLDGPRGSLGPEAETALKAFQSEHRLDADGVYGPDTAIALARAIQLERSRRQGGQKGHVKERKPAAKTNGKERRPAASLRGLIDEVRRLDAQTDHAWQRLVAYGTARQHLAEKVGEGRDPGIAEITAILRRMQQTLETLVTLEQRELALEQTAVAEPAAHAVEAGAATLATKVGAGDNGTGAASALSPAPPPLRLDQLTDAQLQDRIDRLDRAISRSRMVLMRRYVEAEKTLGVLTPRRQTTPHQTTPTTPKQTKPRRARRRKAGPPPQEHIKELQNVLNRFTGKYLENVAPLMVDGVEGAATKLRIRRVKYYLGYRGAQQRSDAVTPKLVQHIEHPRSPRNANPAMLARALARRRKQHKLSSQTSATAAGVATFDGKPVAAWLKPYLEWARAHGWQGVLNSGYRTPEYSEHLCFGICGGPSCPGTCAGRSSHHSIRVKPGGSIDVTDYVRFGELMRQCPYSPRIFNNLPNDRVHHSSTGN